MKKSIAAALGVGAGLAGLGVRDVLQKRHALLRAYPVVGHLRYLLEGVRPEVQQYFIERNFDGRPYNRDVRTVIYERSKGIHGEKAFGTELDVNAIGYEYLVHSVAPVPVPDMPLTVRVGGPDCTRPYEMSLLNVSAMSFGSLSANAVRALNKGAALGGFAHDTGEGGLSDYHLEHGGDLIWEIGSAYFGTRTPDGAFDPAQFADKAETDAVKCISLKLSQGAKPGVGGVLPAAKVSAEIARVRGIPQGVKCVSPSAHAAFSTPVGLLEFVARLRELAGGKPTGFKLCVGSRVEVLAIVKAMLDTGITPDFIVVDGGEGGTGAAPLEFSNAVGMPLTHGLMDVHNALVGAGLRDRIRVGAAGKVSTGRDLVSRLIQGADYTNAARAMMMAIGCIQAQKCHTNKCPVGITTQSAWRQRAVDVPDKAERVRNYQRGTVAEAMRMMAALGAHNPSELTPAMLRQNISSSQSASYAELYHWLEPGELLADPPETWGLAWKAASPDRFGLTPPV